jgi:hypothetical protein
MRAAVQKTQAIPADLLLRKALYCVSIIGVLSLCMAIFGYFFGHKISLGGHTEDTSSQEVVIGNDVLSIPANMIRFAAQRRNGMSERVDLYLHWPDMRGYSGAFADDFNGLTPGGTLLFLTLETRQSIADMSGRYEEIYAPLTDGSGTAGPANLSIRRFSTNSGFINEELVVSSQYKGKKPFVARCLDEQLSEDSPASCQRDFFAGGNLQITYRFPKELLKDWQLLDGKIAEFAAEHIKNTQ